MPETSTMHLLGALTTTLEQLAFFFAEPESGELPLGAGDGVARVRFSGPWTGHLVVRLSGGVLPAFTANMLGCDGTPPAQLQSDALGELANVVCGNVLPRVAGTSVVFHLSPPERCLDWREACGAGVAEEVISVRIDGGRADVALFRD